MSVESVVDDVKARLAQVRAERPMHTFAKDRGQEAEPDGLRLDLQDLDAIARRHHAEGYRAGHVTGFKEGHSAGSSFGAQQRHGEDMATLAAIGEVLRVRLERIPDRLSAPPNGSRDPRTKDELRQEAIDLIDDIRACFGVLLGAMVQGAFDEGS